MLDWVGTVRTVIVPYPGPGSLSTDMNAERLFVPPGTTIGVVSWNSGR